MRRTLMVTNSTLPSAERGGQLDSQRLAVQSVGVLIESPLLIAGKLPLAFGSGESAMADWEQNRALLLAESEPIVRQLFADNETNGNRIVAIGFVYEFGRGQLCFDMCANTASNFQSQFPDGPVDDEVRWNSGDYDSPGGIQDHYGDWSATWWDALSRLDHSAKDKEQFTAVHEGVADICCAVLVELAKRGNVGDWSIIDFNVAALLDDVQLVKQRDERIKSLIKSAGRADT